MAIFQVSGDKFLPVEPTTFASEGIRERQDLQRLLREQISVISENTLVIAEEFGEWEDSRRRIDLLGIDKDANLVVIELKRTEDGGHMDLQAIRYAAMVSNLTFPKVVEALGTHLNSLGRDDDPETLLLEFLEWDEVVEDDFGKDVKIVLASAEFSKELTSAVLWLNDNGLDIRCIRLKPYTHNQAIYVDVQQIIPLPETEEFQISIRNKSLKEKESRHQNKDFTKYTITTGDITTERLAKRQAIFKLVKYLCDEGVDPAEIDAQITWKSNMFQSFEGHLNSSQFEKVLGDALKSRGRTSSPWRYFIADDELIHANGRTYAFHKMWGTRTGKALQILTEKYGHKGVTFEVVK